MNDSDFPSTTYSYFTDPGYQDILYQPCIAIYYIIAGLLTIILNLYLIILFCKFKKLRSNACNVVIIFQCTTELFIGYGCVMRGIILLVSTNFVILNFIPIFCTFVGAMFSFGYRVGQIIALLLAFDRFLAIYKPTYYAQRQNKTTMITHTLIIIVVFVSLIFLYEYGSFSANSFLPLSYCLYGTGYYWDRIIPFYSTVMTIGFFVIYLTSQVLFAIYVSSKKTQNNHSKLSKQQRKLFTSVSLVLLCHCLFYAFPSTLQLLQRQFNLFGNAFNFPGYFINFGSVLYGILNAIIFGLKHQEFKECSMKFYNQLRGKQTSFVVHPINK